MVYFKDRISAAQTSTRRLFTDLCINEEILKSRVDPQLIDELMSATKAYYQTLVAYEKLSHDYTHQYEL